MSLEREVKGILKLEEDTSKAKAEREKKIKALTKKIIKGEGSTGDPIRDFVIVSHGTISEETEQPYRKLEEMLKSKEGEQILVVNEEIESAHSDGCFGGSGYTSVESTLRLGVLTSNVRFEIGDGEEDFLMHSLPHGKADITGPRIILPTERYVKKSDRGYSFGNWELVEGNVEISPFEFHDFNPEGERTESYGAIRMGGPGSSIAGFGNNLIIRVGSENVTDYFKFKRISRKNDLSYVKALKLLRIEDQTPGEFMRGYNEEIGEAKGDVIRGLREFVVLERELIKRTDYDQFQGDRELMDEVAFKLNAPIEKLRETTRKIKSTLERAVKLGMHQEELILDGERPGETLNVPEYITTMCKTYEVPYSEK